MLDRIPSVVVYPDEAIAFDHRSHRRLSVLQGLSP